MALNLTTAPAAEPVSTAEAKTHLRIDVSDDDTYIDTLVVVARLYAESFTNRALIDQSWELKLDRFPASGPIMIPMPPLDSITSIQYVDSAGDTQTWTSTKYTATTPTGPMASPGIVVPAYGETYPTTRDVIDAVTITFKAGYGTASTDVPAGIVHGIKTLVAHMYENRQDVVINVNALEVPRTTDFLLLPYKVWKF